MESYTEFSLNRKENATACGIEVENEEYFSNQLAFCTTKYNRGNPIYKNGKISGKDRRISFLGHLQFSE